MADPDIDLPMRIVRHMLSNDSFSRWMGVEIMEVRKGYCKISCHVNDTMLNGYHITHGGILFSLADSALAFSAATYGRVSLAIDNSLSIVKKTTRGDKLFAESNCLNLTYKTGLFEIKVTDSADELVAVMKATVYRTGEEFNV